MSDKGPLVIIDQQEQRPWSLPFATATGDLRTGDYSIAGLEDVVTIERKSLGDFVGTVIHEWIRFRKELWRMGGMEAACVIVEANVADVMEHRYESDANPQSVLGKATAIFADHGIPVFFYGNREYAALMATKWLQKAWERFGPRK